MAISAVYQPAETNAAQVQERRDFSRLLEEYEHWLVRRTIDYATEHGYTKYTSTLEDAWRVAIAGLSGSLIAAITTRGWQMELLVDEDLTQDPASTFGVLEATRHKSRGITLSMFLGLTKYYRQSYLDLIAETFKDDEQCSRYAHAVNRFFDRIEIAFCAEWVRPGVSLDLADLQATNRIITNEKNKYLTIFDSINVPILLLKPNGAIENVNSAAGNVFSLGGVSGSAYYSQITVNERFAPIDGQIKSFISGLANETSFEASLNTSHGLRHFDVRLKRMLDVSGKYTGVTAILTDITDRKMVEETLRTLSLRDDLTGLHNRRGFETLAQQLLNLARRLGKKVALIYVDLDNLKEINDTYGHPTGDSVLVEIGTLLVDSFRDSDVICRIGGDEFAVLIMVDSDDTADELCTRLLAKCAERNADRITHHQINLSIGIAKCPDPSRCELAQLVSQADALMYADKQKKPKHPPLRHRARKHDRSPS